MATKSIEERAEKFANATIVKSTNFIVWNQVRARYVDIATEQDRIARQEERERCIQAAQDWCCSDCGAQPKCKIDSDELGHPAFGGKCMDRVKIRKAIEEGDNNGND